MYIFLNIQYMFWCLSNCFKIRILLHLIQFIIDFVDLFWDVLLFYFTHHCMMYDTLQWASLQSRWHIHCLQFIFKCIHFNYPCYLQQYFELIQQLISKFNIFFLWLMLVICLNVCDSVRFWKQVLCSCWYIKVVW